MEPESRKRRASAEKEKSPKVRRTEPPAQRTFLLSLPDHVILEIVKLLNSSDLLRLSTVSMRMAAISADESLWKKVDTLERPLEPSQFRKLLKFLGEKTRTFHIGGFASQQKNSLTASILKEISKRCPDVEEFVLENCHIDAKE